MKHGLLIAALGLFIAAPFSGASAQIEFDLNELATGQALLNINATEQQSVDQDELRASLQYIAEGTDQTALQNEVNKAVAKALDTIKKSKNVEHETDQYYVYMVNRNNEKITDQTKWRAQQGITLSGKNADEILILAGKLQETGFKMNGLNYYLSSEKHQETTDAMLKTALIKLQKRAKEAARALGKSDAQLIEIDAQGGGNISPPMYAARAERMMADSSSQIAKPSAAPGKTDVSLTVSARALLLP